MRLICKWCLLISVILMIFGGVSLLQADIHQGTGNLMGLATCGACQEGGSSCNGPTQGNCNNPGAGNCTDKCPGTKGRTCNESLQGPGCGDGSANCADAARPKCLKSTQWPDSWYCSNDQSEDINCGGPRNTCG